MGFKFNPITSELDLVSSTSIPVSTTNYNVNKITLSAGDITTKSVTLTGTPTTLTNTRLIIIGGLEQDYGVDFSCSGTTLSWSGLALDGVLAASDKIIVVFN